MTDKEKAQRLIELLANLGYPVGMGLEPSKADAEKIIRALDAPVLEMRKKQVNKLQLEREELEAALKECLNHVPAYIEERYRRLID